MELQASQISHVNEDVIVDLDPEMATFLDENREIRLLLCQFLHKTISITECFSNLHADFSS